MTALSTISFKSATVTPFAAASAICAEREVVDEYFHLFNKVSNEHYRNLLGHGLSAPQTSVKATQLLGLDVALVVVDVVSVEVVVTVAPVPFEVVLVVVVPAVVVPVVVLVVVVPVVVLVVVLGGGPLPQSLEILTSAQFLCDKSE